MMILSALGVHADVVTNVWIGTSGNWSEGANWEDGTPPVSGEAVRFAVTNSMTVTNDIPGLALAGFEMVHGNERLDNYYLWVYGNAINVPDEGLRITKGINLSQVFYCDFTGTGTLKFDCGFVDGTSWFLAYADATAFAGKVVVDGGMLSVTNRLTTIGDSDQATVIPDAITLRNGAQLKNFATDITIPAWQGVTLDNAGGFLCGWSGNGDFTITVDSPITGTGPLVIPNSACKTALRNGTSDWTGGVIIGTMNAPGAYGTGAKLVLATEGAIPAGSAVKVDGKNGATLDLAGTSPTFADLKFINGGILTNSLETVSTVTAPNILIGGEICPRITLNGTKTYQVPDASIWGTPYAIATGETFSLEGTGGTGGMMFKLNGGTLQFPAAAGFMETTNAGVSIWIDLKAIGGFQSSAVMASSASASLWPSNTTYYYQTMWYIPSDGVYSFVKYFDDQAAIAIDGKTIIADEGYNNVAYSYTNFLNAGWHELRMWYANAIGGVGPGTWSYGIKWASDNSKITASTGKGFSSDTGTFVFTPYAARPVYIGAGGGVLQVVNGANVNSSAVLLRGGLIQTADNTSGDAVTLDGNFIIGNRKGTIAIFDANVTLTSGSTLTFRDAVWFKRLPADGCVIAPGTVCYLSGETNTETFRAAVKTAGGIIGFCDANDSAYGDAIGVATGETFSCRTAYATTADGLPTLGTANSDGVYINARTFTVAEGGTLAFQNATRWRQAGAISGAGNVACSNVKDALNFAGDNSAFSGTWTSTSSWIFWHEPANLGSASAKLVIQGGASIGTADVAADFPQTFTLNSGTLDVESSKATVSSLAITPTNGAVKINGGILEVNATNLTIATGAVINGTGTLLVDIPVGSTYIVPALSGGVTLAFSGAGSIDLRYLGSAFTGILSINSGVTIVSNLQPAANPVLWLDPTAPASLVLANGSTTDVSGWYDVRDGANGSTYAHLYLNDSMPNQKTSGFKSAYAPDLFADSALRPGVIMDFGVVNSGQWFAITPAVTVRTLIYVFGSQNSGGGAPFGCSTDAKGILRGGGMIDIPNKITSSLAMFLSSTYTIANFFNCEAWLDGISVNPQTKSYNGGYQIVSLRLAGDQPIDAIARDNRALTGGQGDGPKRSGGMRYGEMLMYDRALTDSEIVATEAYLRNKWFGITSGSVSSASAITLKTAGTTSIDVPNAQLSTSFSALKGDGTIDKLGAGTLAIGDVGGFGGSIQLDEGGIAIGGGELNPAFWVDASAASSFGTDDNGLVYWRDKRWDGVTDYIVATQRWATAPVLLPNACSGLPVVNMGTLSTIHDRGMQWSANVAAKAIFMLIGSQNSGGTILGYSDTDCPFNRYSFSSYTNTIYSTYTDAGVRAGITRLDGVDVNGSTTGFNGGYQVLTIVPTGPVYSGQFAHDREIDATKNRDGGQRLGEVLIFTNALSSAQIKVVENYLITKWKNGGGGTLGSQTLNGLILGGSANTAHAVFSDGNSTLSVNTLTGSTDFTKNGSGTLCLNGFADYSGKVTVNAGTLALESVAKSALNDATVLGRRQRGRLHHLRRRVFG